MSSGGFISNYSCSEDNTDIEKEERMESEGERDEVSVRVLKIEC